MLLEQSVDGNVIAREFEPMPRFWWRRWRRLNGFLPRTRTLRSYDCSNIIAMVDLIICNPSVRRAMLRRKMRSCLEVVG
jgi:hypothetical protein